MGPDMTNRKTEVQSNGSKWAGQKPDTIQKLLEVLDTHALDRTFEAFGNFVEPLETGGVSFFGNFQEVSHVFSINTTDQNLIKRLTDAIRANQQRPDYLSQQDYATVRAAENAVRIDRDRIKQAEAERAARRTLGIEAA
jgi:hypothetical protein